MTGIGCVSKRRCVGGLAALILLGSVSAQFGRPTEAAEPPNLQANTLQAFREYVALTDERNDAELKNGTGFLQVDTLPPAGREQAYAALRSGQVNIQRLETKKGGEKIRCPGGLIHHWTGVIFIPGAKLQDVLNVIQDYDHHANYYAPDVERSRIEQHEGNHFVVYLRFRRHKVITVVLDTQHDVRYFRGSEEREHSRSSATRIAQVENAGKPNEREKPPGDDDGFLWRMETWWRMEERDGGVYVQSEVVSLTRTIPTGLAWLIGPFVNSIPRETLTFTLEATRRAVQRRTKQAFVSALSPPSCAPVHP
jgi:hypothetical protein